MINLQVDSSKPKLQLKLPKYPNNENNVTNSEAQLSERALETARTSFRDADLCLVTSARNLTLG